jgi:hypothetical protein
MTRSILAAMMFAQTLAMTTPTLKQTPKTAPKTQEPRWESIGACRVTEYCPVCNDPAGYESSSGKELATGDAACSWLPIGTEIRIGDREYTIVDTCGTDAIDLFIDSDECWCDRNEYVDVKIKVKEE